MEIIDNDQPVLLLKEKYYRHEFLKDIEIIIGAWSWKLNDIVDSEIMIENKKIIKKQPIYWSTYKIDTSFLTDFQRNLVFSKGAFHRFYSN